MTRIPSAPLTGEVLLALAAAGGSVSGARAFAEGRNVHGGRAAQVLRAAIGSTAPQDLSSAAAVGVEVGAAVAQISVFGRLAAMGAQQRPFRTQLNETTARLRASFVRGGAAAPISSGGFDIGKMLLPHRCEAHWLATSELARSSPTAAAQAFAASAVSAVADGIDFQCFASGALPSSDAPAALTWASPSFASSGASVASVDADLLLLLKSVTVQGFSPTAWVMPSSAFAFLATLRAAGGAMAYPLLQSAAPVLHGLAVLHSAALEGAGSPSANSISLIDARQVRFADTGEVSLEASGYAAVHASDAPTADAAAGTGATTLVSTYQVGATAFKATTARDWALLTPSAAAVLTSLAF